MTNITNPYLSAKAVAKKKTDIPVVLVCAIFAAATVSATMKMLGRSKDARNTGASDRSSWWRISSTVRGSAVAVSARRGTPGNRAPNTPRPRYSGRK